LIVEKMNFLWDTETYTQSGTRKGKGPSREVWHIAMLTGYREYAITGLFLDTVTFVKCSIYGTYRDIRQFRKIADPEPFHDFPIRSMTTSLSYTSQLCDCTKRDPAEEPLEVIHPGYTL